MNTLPLWFVCLCFAGLGGVVWLLIAGERSTQRRPLRLCSVCGNPAAAPMVRHGAVTCSTRCDRAHALRPRPRRREGRLMTAVEGHLTTTYRAEVLAKDYMADTVGATRWLATCSCGWHSVRQYEHAMENQLAKHLDARRE